MNGICYQYNLPDPLLLLKNPPSQKEFKTQVKLNVLDYWQIKLRNDAAQLEKASLALFRPVYISLLKTTLTLDNMLWEQL